MKCSRKDCSDQARWRPVLLLRTKSPIRPPPARVVVGIGVCDAHKIPHAEVYITDESWKAMLDGFDRVGKMRPHRSLTEVTYVDIDDPRAGVFERDYDA